jgi:phosphohistidine phosphatase
MLWLLRHAKTVADPPPGGDDFDRVLAPRGRRDATALGDVLAGTNYMAGLGLGVIDSEVTKSVATLPLPQVAFVSPAARTTATANLVLGQLAAAPQRQAPEGLYGAEPEDVLDLIRALPDHVGSVMVIGHNPTMQALALGLLAERDTARHTVITRGFPTCALGLYSLELGTWSGIGAGTAQLIGLVTPPFATS